MSSYPNDWHSFYLKNIAKNVNDKNTNKEFINVFTNSAVKGIINQTEFFNKDIANEKNTDKYTIVRENDFVYNPRVSLSAPYGPININESNLVGVVSPLYTVFRIVSSSVSTEYMKHYFRSTLWHKYLYNISNEGARHDRMSISLGDFFDMPIRLPKLHEQKKIAEILSTWDEAIELKKRHIQEESKYYEELLFLIIEKNTSSGEKNITWIEKPLSQICHISTGKLNANAMSEGGKYKFFTCAKEDYFVDTFAFDGEALLIAGNGNIGTIKYYSGKFNAYQRTYVLTQIKENIIYVKGFMDLHFMKKVVAEKQQGAMPFIKLSTLSDFIVKCPSRIIQSKIASIIDEKTKKLYLMNEELNLLMKQKQGLMQRLLTGKVRVKLD